ncbi:hypothetical protein ON010_g10852 [Phytophthora cinnamomi]|nr:hypothetical protein ON010_g10852 [Phytophthora cinnamomi]
METCQARCSAGARPKRPALTSGMLLWPAHESPRRDIAPGRNRLKLSASEGLKHFGSMTMSSEEEEYDFDYSDEDEDMEDAEADLHVRIENAYYSAKQLLEGEPPAREEALDALQQVLALQSEQTDWGFKALKRTVKLLFELRRHDEAMRRYEELLGYTKTAVTRNVGEKGINSILDFVSTSKVECAQVFYY